jgi:CRP/FNR family transcriptional regulator, polysaccharide utilization system transcription regulator
MPVTEAGCAFCQEPTGKRFCELAGIELGVPRAEIGHRSCLPREIIFPEGGPPAAAHCIRSGIVKLSKRGSRGEPLIIRLLGSGHLIGYRAVLAGEPYAATAEAVGAVELCTIPLGSFAATLRSSPLFSERLLAMMARELRVSEEQTLALAHETVRARSVRLLVGFLDDTGPDHAPGNPILVPLQRWELAQMVSTSPETLSRTLHQLAREGILQLTRTEIYVRDPRRLRAIAGR